MYDLNQLDVVALANAGTVLELLHPGNGEVLTDKGSELGDPKNVKPFFIRMLGSDSDVYREGTKRHLEKSMNSKKKAKVDLDEAKLKAAELIAKCTTECYFIEDGKVVECTKSEMVRIYLKYPWIREQAEAHMSDRSALMQS